jgi:hypothetical protein
MESCVFLALVLGGFSLGWGCWKIDSISFSLLLCVSHLGGFGVGVFVYLSSTH